MVKMYTHSHRDYILAEKTKQILSKINTELQTHKYKNPVIKSMSEKHKVK